jgi:hypothetical protein
MSVVLYVLGIVSAVAGIGAIVFGIPVKEFSFGDTLIGAGATGLVGGLILIGLGAAVAQLQRIAEFLGARPLARAGQGPEPAVRVGSGAGRVPFPPKPKSEPRDRGADMPVISRLQPKDKENEQELGAPPSLANPDMPLMADEEAEQLPLSPRDTATPRKEMPAKANTRMPEAPNAPPASDWSPPAPPRPNYFEKMWPGESRTPSSAVEPALPRDESIPRLPEMDDMEPAAVEPRDDEIVPAAVLKSGVVDGMGYTLYVDGSIEAELPDGTLRFASINELRAHLEKNS